MRAVRIAQDNDFEYSHMASRSALVDKPLTKSRAREFSSISGKLILALEKSLIEVRGETDGRRENGDR